MAASSSSDIPDSKSDYCPCNRCGQARKEGRQEKSLEIEELTERVTQLETQLKNATNYCEISGEVCGICPMKQVCTKAGLVVGLSNEKE